MPPARAECQYCAQTFSKRCHLYRHWRMNRCASHLNPHHRRVRCPHCNGEFASEPNLRLHISRNRCAILRQQTQQTDPQPPSPQLPLELSSMPRRQQIGWIMEVLAMNDEQVIQNVVQSIWAMAGAAALRLPTVDNRSESRISEEAPAEAAGQQQTTSKRSA